MHKVLAVSTLFSLWGVQNVLAQDDDGDDFADEQPRPQPSMWREAEGVDLTAIFPGNDAKTVAAGEKGSILIGFYNGGSETYNVEAVFGHLANPAEMFRPVYNFTPSLYNISVEENDEASVLYNFFPDARIDPATLGIVINVYYRNEANTSSFVSNAFNGTVDITDAVESLDVKTVALFAVPALIILGLYFGKATKKSKKAAAAPKAPAGPKVASGTAGTDADEWISRDHKQIVARNAKKSTPKRNKNNN